MQDKLFSQGYLLEYGKLNNEVGVNRFDVTRHAESVASLEIYTGGSSVSSRAFAKSHRVRKDLDTAQSYCVEHTGHSSSMAPRSLKDYGRVKITPAPSGARLKAQKVDMRTTVVCRKSVRSHVFFRLPHRLTDGARMPFLRSAFLPCPDPLPRFACRLRPPTNLYLAHNFHSKVWT